MMCTMKDNSQLEEAEWANAQQVFLRFGLMKSTLFKLAEAGKIRSAVFKPTPGGRKSVRLFGIQSIRQLLEESVS